MGGDGGGDGGLGAAWGSNIGEHSRVTRPGTAPTDAPCPHHPPPRAAQCAALLGRDPAAAVRRLHAQM